MTILNVVNLEKYYGSKGNVTKAVDGISFSIEAGEYVGIMGASGSGKTTILNCISTIDRATAGHIHVEDKDITTIKSSQLAKFRRESLGFIFQEFNLLDTLTGYENIALALTIQKTDHKEIDSLISKVTSDLNITSIIHKFPYQMSGGEKQRVAAARAIVSKPKLILADEPTGALDSKASRQLLEALTHLNKKMEATIMMVTHDAFTASYCDRIIFIKDGRLFTELRKKTQDRKAFFNEIIDVLSLLGGEHSHVF